MARELELWPIEVVSPELPTHRERPAASRSLITAI
jgi:hypothetical protein